MAKDSFRSAGGRARAKTMTPAQRSECARRAAHQRWHGKENPDPNLGSAFTGPNWPKCAVCRRASNAHNEKTNACPDLDAGGWASTTYLHPSLVPKLRADLVTAYSLALEAIATMQAEKMNWQDWDTDPPKPGRLVTLHTGGKVNDFTGRVMDDGARIQVVQDNAIVWAIKGAKWYALPEYPKP